MSTQQSRRNTDGDEKVYAVYNEIGVEVREVSYTPPKEKTPEDIKVFYEKVSRDPLGYVRQRALNYLAIINRDVIPPK